MSRNERIHHTGGGRLSQGSDDSSCLERRRYQRFGANQVQLRLGILHRGEDAIDLAECELVNICYGGMCFRSHSALREDVHHEFLVDLRFPMDACVLVKARVCWSDPARHIFGVAFLESSKGWFGREDPPAEAESEEAPGGYAGLSAAYSA